MAIQKTVLDSSNDSMQGNNVGGTAYEIYSISTVQDEDNLIVVINTNFPLSGVGEIAAGDLLFNFGNSNLQGANGSLYGVRFAGNNDSGVSQLGLYSNVSAVSVASQNTQFLSNYGAYNQYISNHGGTPSAGELSAGDTYFSAGSHVPNVIQSGNHVSDVQVRNAANLQSRGITTQGAGSNTFGIAIPRSCLPSGAFTLSWSPECNNDLVAIRDTNNMTLGVAIEKSLNGHEADTDKDAVRVREGAPAVFEYAVKNTGNVSFLQRQVRVTDSDQRFVPTLDVSSDRGRDGILSPDETWVYRASGALQQTPVNRINFDTDGRGRSLAAGTIIDTEYSNLGIQISTPNAGDCDAMIFDSSNPSRCDRDLGTSNRDFGGPGVGVGGRRGRPGENRYDRGNVLIVSQDGNCRRPNDDRNGGTIRFEFDELVGLSGVGLLDIDRRGGTITTFDEDGKRLGCYNMARLGNNSFQEVKICNDLVAAVEVTFRGDGAITHLDYCRLYRNTGTVTVDASSSLSASDRAFAQVLPPAGR
ncbi:MULTISPECIES: XDD3 family exosortase-dependent surface protein [unclassified Leptolyngbya]|uniref:XDD3 family exosortase-dependent surface protein n=1 Tax=unclassified Leptolyngbya TaxID=2650499 RepID=UPI001685A660|nr:MULTISPECIES: XDD3 family exosortase-dependent surface protein [unclassified Leptolyngbya]MBD1913399.1 hypothetical protein [Leptolyngbya sp. FACHB-8]MBD2158670.1 hypothetical protein [Leptolyngbya sp. FACHB-16]